MKLILILAVLLTVLQTAPPVPRQTTDSSAQAGKQGQKQGGSNQPKAAPAPAPLPAGGGGPSQANGDNQRKEDGQYAVRVRELPPVSVTRDWADWGYWAFGALLVLVGFLQVWLLYQTRGEIKRQADTMDRQGEKLAESLAIAKSAATAARDNAEAAHRQADTMDKQTAILGESVAAAKASAKAAQDGVELIISKERARLRVAMLPFDLSSNPTRVEIRGGPTPLLQAHGLSFVVTSYGPTPAFITGSSAIGRLLETEDADCEADVPIPIIGLPEIVLPSAGPITSHTVLWEEVVNPEAFNAEKIRDHKLFIHVCGYIRYKDAFDRERETTFCLRWEPKTGLVIMGDPDGYWVKRGPPEANRET
jgi:hypothetical protein